jgi:hypothetical protein
MNTKKDAKRCQRKASNLWRGLRKRLWALNKKEASRAENSDSQLHMVGKGQSGKFRDLYLLKT